MSELTEKLRVQPTASQFLKPAHLYEHLIDERTEAADAIEAKDLLIAEMSEALDECAEDLRKSGFDLYASQLEAITSKAKHLQTQDKGEGVNE